MRDRAKRLKEAKSLLRDLGLPVAQQNERSALILLALADLQPGNEWGAARNDLIGVTPIMDWIGSHYRRNYAPNTRETIRRQTLHQFVQAGIVAYNPDDPVRPVNSPLAVYRLTDEVVELIRSYGSTEYEAKLKVWLANYETLAAAYRRQRDSNRVSLKLADGQELNLSAGKHSDLIKLVVEDFGPRFVTDGALVYVGDTGSKFQYCDHRLLLELGITIDTHGKMPDVILFSASKRWLFLVECVTSHGPVNPKRQRELEVLFSTSKAGCVYVSAFPDRRTFTKYISDIAWETEVWIADSPDHLVHFDGERFLGPY